LSHFDQLDAKILHGLQCPVKLCLITEDTDQDGIVGCLLNVQVQCLECRDECIIQFTAYPDLIGKAPSALSHDRAAAAWPHVARAQIAAKNVMPTVHLF
jgi:hypothetical protein